MSERRGTVPKGKRKQAGASARPDELSSALRSAREATGVTLSRAAQRAGITAAALHFLETGKCQPSLRTMAALLEAMPELAPLRQLALGGAEDSMTPSGRGGFAAAALAFGMSCDRIEVSRSEVRIEGLRATVADGNDPAVRRALMRAACVGDGNLKRRLEAGDTAVEDGKHKHSFAWTEDAVDYLCTGPRRLEWTCLFPARELLFRATKPLSIAVRSQTGGPEIGDALHPRREKLGKGLAKVDYPVAGVVYEAGFKGVPWDAPLGQVMRQHREAAGLTQKEVAEAAGVRMTSVSAFETGGIEWPRTDHVAGYLRALPEFPPQRALPGPDVSRRPSAEESFEQAVQVAGLECAAIEKTIRIEPDGTRHSETIVRELRSAGISLSERTVQFPGVPAPAQVNADVLRAIRADLETPEAALKRTHRFPGGVLEIKWAKRRGVFGATLVRSLEPAQSYAMTAERARKMFKTPGPHSEGASVPVPLPAREVRLVVELPSDHEHVDLRRHLWPTTVFPQHDLPPLFDTGLIPLEIESDGEVVRYTVRTRLLPPGFQLALGWRLTGYS